MLAIVPSATVLGVDGRPVTVEVHVSNGLPGFAVVGLPDASCREARDRVRSALLSSGLDVAAEADHGQPGAVGQCARAGAGSTSPSPSGVLVASEQLPPEAVRGPRLRRRARPRRLGPRPVPGHGAAGRRARCRRGGGRRWRRRSEAELVGRHKVRAVGTLGRARAGPAGRRAVARPPAAHRRRAAATAARPGRRARSAAGPAGARAGGRRRSPPAVRRPARRRQDDAGPPPARAPPAARPRRRHARRPASTRRPASGCRPSGLVETAAVPGAAPLVDGGVARGWRHRHDAAGRDQPGVAAASCSSTSWPSSRRTCSTPLRQPLEEGADPGEPGPVSVDAARPASCSSPPPTRVPCGEAGRPGACRCTDQARLRYQRRLSGPAARPVRPARRRAPARRRRPARRCAGGAHRADRRPGRRGPGPGGGARRALQRRAAEGDELERETPLTDDASGLLATVLRKGALSARGLTRIRRVARDDRRPRRARRPAHRGPDRHRTRAAGPAGDEPGVGMSGPEPDDEEVVALVALSALPAIGPGRLLALHRAGDVMAGPGRRCVPATAIGCPRCAIGWARSPRPRPTDGRGRPPASNRPSCSTVTGPPASRSCVLGTPAYPQRLATDPEPPAVVFHRGDPDALDRPTVAIVGTRNATRVGREVAHEMGDGLAAVGVAVVSGLALGIDGAAHRARWRRVPAVRVLRLTVRGHRARRSAWSPPVSTSPIRGATPTCTAP